MKLTKFAHACFSVEENGAVLVVDPGSYSEDVIVPKRVVAIVITHEHPDHMDRSLIQKIIDKNPGVIIVGHESITTQFGDRQTLAAHPGETQTIGTFSLEFFGGTHATITESLAVPPNIGVVINNTVCYPGDSFALPPTATSIPILALPVSAPWLKLDESLQYLKQVHPSMAFPTHDAILSPAGKTLVDRMVGGIAQSLSIEYKRLDSSSIELSKVALV